MFSNRKITHGFLIIPIVGMMVSCTQQNAIQRDMNNIVDRGEWVSLLPGVSIGNYHNKGGEIYWSKFYPEEYNYYYSPFKGVDIESFKVCKYSDYAKDKNRVYYPVSVCCIDGTEYGGCYAEEYVVEGADPSTFKYVGNGYAVDSCHMYSEGEEIPWDNVVISSKGRILRNPESKEVVYLQNMDSLRRVFESKR